MRASLQKIQRLVLLLCGLALLGGCGKQIQDYVMRGKDPLEPPLLPLPKGFGEKSGIRVSAAAGAAGGAQVSGYFTIGNDRSQSNGSQVSAHISVNNLEPQ